MLRPVPRRQRYQATPRGPAFSRHPTCFRSPYRPTELDLVFTPNRFLFVRDIADYMRAMQDIVYIYCDLISECTIICLPRFDPDFDLSWNSAATLVS